MRTPWTSRQSELCECGTRPARWEDITDAMTGTAYVRCRACGRHHLASPHGYVEWRVGLFMQRPNEIGSAWTQKTAPNFFTKESGLTDWPWPDTV